MFWIYYRFLVQSMTYLYIMYKAREDTKYKGTCVGSTAEVAYERDVTPGSPGVHTYARALLIRSFNN